MKAVQVNRKRPNWGKPNLGPYSHVKDLAEEYVCVRNWMLNLAKRTRKNYKMYMRRFMQFSGWNPDQILEQARQDRLSVHVKMKEFYYKLADEENLSSMSRSQAYSGIRSFLFWHEIAIGRAPREFVGRVQYEAYRVLEPSEISLMVDYARTARDQALITFLTQSGQRAGILTSLKYCHVQDQLERGVNPIIIGVTPMMLDQEEDNANKGRVKYRFAIGREATSFLRISINHRRRLGEQITRDSWLFRSRGRFDNRYASDGRPIWKKLPDSDPSVPLKISAIRYRVFTIAKRAGLDRTRPRLVGNNSVSHEIHPHVFRRFWKLQMRKGGVVDSDLLDYMMGHHNLRLMHGGNYDEYDPDYIRREYSKAEPYLTVTTDPLSYGQPSSWQPGVPVHRLENPRLLAPGETPIINRHSRRPQTQRVVDETELNKHFALGWHYVTTLPSGKVIVSMDS